MPGAEGVVPYVREGTGRYVFAAMQMSWLAETDNRSFSICYIRR